FGFTIRPVFCFSAPSSRRFMPASLALASLLIIARCSGAKPCAPSSSVSLGNSRCDFPRRGGTEQNRHAKSDDRDETHAPRKFRDGQRSRLGVEPRSEKAGEPIGQTAQNR